MDPDDPDLSLTGEVVFFTQACVLPELNRYSAENPGLFDVIAGMNSIGATNVALHAAMNLGNSTLKLRWLRKHRDWRQNIMDVLVRVAKLKSVDWLRTKLEALMESAPDRLERRPGYLATSLRGDDLIRWFEDVLLCLPRNGVQATLDYIAEERRSWHAACVGAETCRPFEPLGPLAKADMEASEAGAAPAPAPSSPAAPPAAVPPPQSHTNDAADENSWACPACTYRHEGAEAGFLQCAMCGAEKDPVSE